MQYSYGNVIFKIQTFVMHLFIYHTSSMANINWMEGNIQNSWPPMCIVWGLDWGQYTHQGHAFYIYCLTIQLIFIILFAFLPLIYLIGLKLVKNKRKNKTKWHYTQVQGKKQDIAWRVMYRFIAWPCHLFRPIVMPVTMWANNTWK